MAPSRPTLTLLDGGAVGETMQFPRSQVGPQPQHLLVTLLADYFLDVEEFVPSAGLVALLEEFGITSSSARAALSRLSRRGVLANSRSGRHTAYRLTPESAALLRERARRILDFGAIQSRWSGAWTVVAFSVPEEQRRTRPVLRARLRWLGFAPLYDGVWISPHRPSAKIDEILDELGVPAATVFVGEIRERSGREDPLAAWDLDDLQGLYSDFIEDFTELHERTANGEVGSAEALVARTTVMDRWRNVPSLDPDLPAELLPNDWPRSSARALFLDVHEGLRGLAEVRVRQVLSEGSVTSLDAVRSGRPAR